MRYVIFCLYFILSCVATSINADTAPVAIAQVIRQNLSKALPLLPIDQVNLSAMPDVYEIVSGRKVFYSESTARYVMLGNLIDLTTKNSLTQQKVQDLSIVNWNQLPINIAIIRVIGAGERKIAVFTDPECPFCKRLDADIIAKQKNLTVYYFLYPLSMHAGAENDSKRILCAENPETAYLNWMILDKILPVQNKCNRSLDLVKMKKAGDDIVGVEVTPTIVLPNGQVISGLIPADYLAKLIVDSSTKPINDKAISSGVNKTKL